jgi:hypothetical protein
MIKPSFFIVGAPKTGTTSLYRYLKQHPQIFMSSPKELVFFNTDMSSSRKKNLEQYCQHFEEGEGKICGEASPQYLRSYVAAENIYNFNPEAKIIIMLRDPVNLLYSYHYQRHFNGLPKTVEDFQLAVEQEAEKIRTQTDSKLDLDSYRNVVKFTEQIERFYKFFAPEKVKIIIFDEFAKNTEKVYQEVLEFLEVDPSFKAVLETKNPSKKVRSKFIRDFIKKPPNKILEIGKFFIPLPRKTRRYILEKLKFKIRKINKFRTEKEPLDLEFCLRLQKEFAPEIEKLSLLINKDLTYWNHEDYLKDRQKLGSE